MRFICVMGEGKRPRALKAVIPLFMFAASCPYLAYKLTILLTRGGSVPAAAGTRAAAGFSFFVQIYSFFKSGF